MTPKEFAELYAQLTPENRQKVDDKIAEMMKEQEAEAWPT